MSWDELPATLEGSELEPRPLRQRGLLVISEAGERVVHLPEQGVLEIGRAPNSGLWLEDPLVSRQHATLHLGPQVEIQDLASANGTHLAGRKLPPVRVCWPEAQPLRLGSTTLVLLARALATQLLSAERAPSRAPQVVEDPAMRELLRLVERVARGTITVLLLGETGVGKEVFAEAVHRSSQRASRPFVRINCAALSESLIESELFGHQKGAFTGAAQAKPGLLETAEGGTVFLDELGEISPALQTKLLRVIEQRQVIRVGGLSPRPIDVRWVSATNRDLAEEVEQGRFRRDLYYRLNGVTLEIPPLRDRPKELEPLAMSFARQLSIELGRPPPRFSAQALALLQDYPWPGNLRELRNVIERALLVGGEGVIDAQHLRLGRGKPLQLPARPSRQIEAEATGCDDERLRIISVLDRCAGNQTRAAELLGISRRTLSSRLNAHQIPRPRKG